MTAGNEAVQLAQQNRFGIRGLQEVVVSVSDLEQYGEFFAQVAGWELMHDGEVDRGLLQQWGLAPELTAREVLMANPGDDTGWLRLLQFEGCRPRQIRSNAQLWEVGGILDINMRTLDMSATCEQMMARGWRGSSDPVEWSFGPYRVIEWLAHGPDGLCIACIQRVAPPLEGWDTMRAMSRVFNSTQCVRDMARARDFYLRVLDFKEVMRHAGTAESPGPNVLGLPHNMIAETPHELCILHPAAANDGSIELISFGEVYGRDLSEHAQPPNLGAVALRFPLQEHDLLVAQFEREGLSYRCSGEPVQLHPYGSVQLLSVQAPDGAWLDFYTPA